MLMLTSIGIVSFITANMAAFFVGEDEGSGLDDEIRSLHRHLDRVEELLSHAAPSDTGS